MTQPPRSTPLPLTALALALVVLGIGAAIGWLAAWRSVASHGYLEQSFARGAFFTFRDMARAGVAGAWPWAVGVGAAFLVVVFVWRRGVPGDGSRDPARAIASRSVAAWAVVLIGVLATAALIEVQRERDWIGQRDVIYVVAFTLACAAALLAISKLARGAANESRSLANVHGALAAFVVAAPAVFWLGRELPYHSTEASTWIAVGLVVPIALLVFAWTRARAVARAAGRPTRWIAGPLGVGASVSALLVLAPFVLALFESRLAAPTFTVREPWNVVVIAIDTLRADQLSLDGANPRGRDTTPNLRRLAERGVVFDNAISQAPWTLPAFASILTGVYPHEHGAYSITGRLRERETTLAEVLREAGYQTLGVVSQVHLARGIGIEQGCDVFDDSSVVSEQALSGQRTSDAALRALERIDASRPFFAFLHYFDPHSEYVDHDDLAWTDGYEGWLREQLAYDNLERNRERLDAADIKYVLDVYDEETAYTDRQVGRVLDELERRGLAEGTLIVLCVDHGEQFLEHGGFGHTTTLYDELIRVPLIVVPPGSKLGSRRAEVVETSHVFGTVLATLGIESASGARKRWSAHQSRSLLTTPSEPGEPAYSIVWLPDSKASSGKQLCLSAVREGRWKLIHDWTRDRRMLFDLESDPGERNDVFERESQVGARLGAELDAWTLKQLEHGGPAALRSLDRRSIDALKKLGYLGDGH